MTNKEYYKIDDSFACLIFSNWMYENHYKRFIYTQIYVENNIKPDELFEVWLNQEYKEQ